MTTLLLVLAVLAAPYGEVREEALKTNKPMFVLVGAMWCPACQTMKNEVIPTMQRRGEFPDVLYATIDWDQENALARTFQRLAKTDKVPVLFFFRRIAGKWQARYHVGSLQAEQLKGFLTVRRE